MSTIEQQQGEGFSRREFLKVGAISAGAVSLTLPELSSQELASREKVNCILLFLVGGPSHLDTWDLKPAAPSNVRGPFKPISTSVPGIEICEHFPKMAKLAKEYALIRSVHHDSSPIHETGHQLMQTGRLSSDDLTHPHYGAVLSHLRGERKPGVAPFAILSSPIGSTGVSVGHGQSAGYLGQKHEPVILPDRALDLERESTSTRELYGNSTFGRSCLQARRLIERGSRLVTVNMFDTVFNNITWDCHADGGSLGSNLDDYRRTLCPMFDSAYSALIEDLKQRGMLETTLVLAMGEFGRTPQMNPRGGRDHWPNCWSILAAGGGIRGGQVIGSSDKTGSEPHTRPVTPAEIASTVYFALGVNPQTEMTLPEGRKQPLVDAPPIRELFV